MLSDLAGVALVVVLVTGVWIWLRRVRARGRLVGARPGSAWLRANWWFHLVGGLVAAVFLIVLSVTGVLLNHKKDLGLMAAPADLPRRWDVWVEDLHSGLLFGSRGWLLSDLGAVLAILWTVNGTYLWLVPSWRARNRSALS